MKGLIAILAIAICSGCASTAQWVQDNPEEAAWQALHVMDALQTANSTRDGLCYMESDPQTRLIIGERPERDRVYKWAVGNAVAHYLFFKAVEGTRFDKPLRVADMVFKINVVYDNHVHQGIRMYGKNKVSGNCRGG